MGVFFPHHQAENCRFHQGLILGNSTEMEPLQSNCVKCGKQMDVTRLRCETCDVAVEGVFELTPLAKLSLEEQAFVTAFVRVHGSIKKMESLFGISYPTVKNRLNTIAGKLDASIQAPDETSEVLDRLARGEIDVDQALELLP